MPIHAALRGLSARAEGDRLDSMPLHRYALGVLVILALVYLPAAAVPTTVEEEVIAVSVYRQGDALIVDTSFEVPVDVQEAWDVLTDFDHLVGVVSNLEASAVTGRKGSTLIVTQRVRANAGPLQFTFETQREVELTPFEEIRSHLLSGNMKYMDGRTLLHPEGGSTRVTSHGVFVPDAWIPPVIGVQAVERETRRQFAEMRAEMLRRHAKRAGVPRRVSLRQPGEAAAPKP
jgi:hypothetical protein